MVLVSLRYEGSEAYHSQRLTALENDAAVSRQQLEQVEWSLKRSQDVSAKLQASCMQYESECQRLRDQLAETQADLAFLEVTSAPPEWTFSHTNTHEHTHTLTLSRALSLSLSLSLSLLTHTLLHQRTPSQPPPHLVK